MQNATAKATANTITAQYHSIMFLVDPHASASSTKALLQYRAARGRSEGILDPRTQNEQLEILRAGFAAYAALSLTSGPMPDAMTFGPSILFRHPQRKQPACDIERSVADGPYGRIEKQAAAIRSPIACP
ncbi:hypothetical protein GS424_011610 [Eggerthella guodeyinii]|uniref:Uncharacterized protein n=1 Tax=Eggerthella guodeyinii TaxID=2690837 RepID=A0A6L7IXJ1_9ACTN|nr:hypothetical protein [Eggerthella guodeyinii]QOS67175.1 hypothetical protein GS424_011610 [Eggerthella guodeyinii]